MTFVTKNDSGLAVAAGARAGASARACEPAEESPHAVEKAWWRCWWPVVGRRWQRWGSGMRNRRCWRGIYVPAKFDGRAQPHFTHEQDGFGSRVGRRFGRIGVKTERWHQHRIHRLSPGSGRGRDIISPLAFRRQRGSEGSEISSRSGMRSWRRLGRFQASAREIARTGGGVRLKRFYLPAGEADLATLWNDHALVGKLRLDPHRAARREDAHFAVLFEAYRQVAGTSSNGDRRGNNRRRVNREFIRGFQRWMDAAIIKRKRQGPRRFDQFEMRGTANADLAAGVQQKKGMSGTKRDVAAAGDDGWRGVRFDTRRCFRCDFEVISFDSPEYDWEILRRDMGVPNEERCRNRQQCDRENFRPNGQMLLSDR
jgi:hypothetical protein